VLEALGKPKYDTKYYVVMVLRIAHVLLTIIGMIFMTMSFTTINHARTVLLGG
jgi:hypothetical protein